MSGVLKLNYKRTLTILKVRRRRVLVRDDTGEKFWLHAGSQINITVTADVPIEDRVT